MTSNSNGRPRYNYNIEPAPPNPYYQQNHRLQSTIQPRLQQQSKTAFIKTVFIQRKANTVISLKNSNNNTPN